MLNIKTTGEILEGICDIKLENCKAKESGIVTIVHSTDEDNKQILVCKSCLHKMIRKDFWYVRGA